jgi:O-antigen/teichoic acid export membrane protein
LRYACFARGRPSPAAWGDSLWLAVQLVVSAALFGLGQASVTSLVAVWAGAGALSTLFLAVRLAFVPRLAAAAGWLGAHAAVWRRLLVEFAVGSASHYGVYYGLAIVAGAGEFGRVKAAQVFLGPAAVLVLAGGSFGVPESVRAVGDRTGPRQVAFRLSMALVGGALACGVAAFVLSPVFGPPLFPHAWADARPLIPVMTAFAAAFGASTGIVSALRALGESRWLLATRTVTGAVVLVAGIAASAPLGAHGALVSLAVGEWAFALLSWRRLSLRTATAMAAVVPGDGRRRPSAEQGVDSVGWLGRAP